jgi:hypothetical protein
VVRFIGEDHIKPKIAYGEARARNFGSSQAKHSNKIATPPYFPSKMKPF